MTTTNSYSEINTYAECPRKYYYRVVLNLQRKAKKGVLVQGSHVHRILEQLMLHYQNGGSAEHSMDVVQMISAELRRDAHQNPLFFEDELEDEITMIDRAEDIVTRLLDFYDFSDWEILHVEEQFEFTFVHEGTWYAVTFTPDLVVRSRSTGKIWIVDWKTTTGKPGNEVEYSDMQSLVYVLGVRAFYPNDEVAGFIFFRLRKAVPTEPRLTKQKDKATGKPWIADIKRIDTTYEILLDFIDKHAPWLQKDAATLRRLSELRGVNNFFWADTVLVTPEMESATFEDITGWLRQIVESEENARYPRNLRNQSFGGCNRCSFKAICHTELVGLPVDDLIASEYEERDPKNEYEVQEDDEVL